MHNRNKLAFCILGVVFVVLMIYMIGRNGNSTAEKILSDDYYDWSYPSDYSFIIQGTKWTVEDIHKLPEEYYSDLMGNDLQTIELKWNSEAKTATECKQEDSDTTNYYLFDLNMNSLILIPAKNTFQIFEESRPFAFFLVRSA